MILKILTVNNPEELKILTTPSKDVDIITPLIKDLAVSMSETMFVSNGIGLAAPQIGSNLNIFVMQTMDSIRNNTQESIVLINPKTVMQSPESDYAMEGCLSIPGIQVKVKRSKRVQVQYLDVDGNLHNDLFEGLQARIYQHELSHLFGKLITTEG